MASLNINLNSKNDNTIEQKWTYRDIDIVQDDIFKDIKDVIAIRSSISNIFSWRQGQRILDPEFGNILYLYLYEGANDITEENMKKGIMKMLKYEPRINVLQINVDMDNDNSEVKVDIEYSIPSINRTITDILYIT